MSVDDWRRLASADPDMAREELAAYLASRPDTGGWRTGSIGVVAGFIAGALLMVVVWVVTPPLYDHWKETDSALSGLGSIFMLCASLLPFACAYAGWSWDRRRAAEQGDGSFEEMLQQLERVR